MVLPRSALAGADGVAFVLALTWAGRTFYLSTVALTFGDGRTTHATMELAEVAQSFQRLSVSAQDSSASFGADLGLDVAELVAQGHLLTLATGELSMVPCAGQTPTVAWADRLRLFSGHLVTPQFGDPLRPVGFIAATLRSEAWEGGRPLIGPRQLITGETWPSAHEGAEGKAYPIPIGTPGALDSGHHHGSPAYVVEVSAGNAEKLLISGVPVAAATVEISDGTTWESFTVEHQLDGAGQTVAVVDVTAAATISRAEAEYWVAWTDGPGIMDSDTGQGITTMGEAARALMRLSGSPMDHGQVSAALPALTARVGLYVNDPSVTGWDVIAGQLLPLWPVSVANFADGLGLIPWVGQTADPSVVDLDVLERVGPVTLEDADVVRSVTIRYADGTKSVQHVADWTVDDRRTSSGLTVQRNRWGRGASVTLEAAPIWTRSAADACALALLSASAAPVQVLSFQAPMTAGIWALGQDVAVSSTALHLVRRRGQIISRIWTGSAWLYVVAMESATV